MWQDESRARLKDSPARRSIAETSTNPKEVSNSDTNVSMGQVARAENRSIATSSPSPVEVASTPVHEPSFSHSSPSTHAQSRISGSAIGDIER